MFLNINTFGIHSVVAAAVTSVSLVSFSYPLFCFEYSSHSRLYESTECGLTALLVVPFRYLHLTYVLHI